MTIAIKTRRGWTGYRTGGDGTESYLVGPASKGAQFPSLAAAVAQAVSDGATEPTFMLLVGGDYTADVTLPANSSVVGLEQVPTIIGQITVPTTADDQVVLFENLHFERDNPGTSVSADFGGTGTTDQPVIRFVQCAFTLEGGGVTGVSASACTVEFSGQTAFDLDDAIGIDLTASDGVDNEPTEFLAEFLAFVSDSANDVCLRTGNGVGGNDDIGVQISWFSVESHDEGTGIQLRHAVAGPSAFDGIRIDSFEWRGNSDPGGFAIDAVAGFTFTQIGRLFGDSVADTLVAFGEQSAHSITIDDLGFGPGSASLGGRTDFIVCELDGSSSLFINGGDVVMGSGTAFEVDGSVGQGQNPTLRVRGVDFNGVNNGGGAVVEFDGARDNFALQFDKCNFALDGAAGRPIFDVVGADAPGGCDLEFTDSVIVLSPTADDVAIQMADATLRIGGLQVVHTEGDNGTIDFVAAGGVGPGSLFTWFGNNSIIKPTGAGISLTFVDDPNMSIVENGMLDMVMPPAEQLSIGLGTQVLTNNVGYRKVCYGFQSTAAVADIVGQVGSLGIQSSYSGLHVVSQIARTLITTAGDDTGSYQFSNEDTGIQGTTAFGEPGAGGVVTQQAALGAGVTMLVGPGQRVSLACTVEGGGGATDVQVEAG